ncbi:MAG: trypsin-like peptidase domain-containing protein [Gemmatimonadaceae bacterium]|nr:trypsin-like peptidase domain-containing protein [Gemmatimonadaceae bacterium]
MERVILRHLKGSKASQVEEFPLQGFAELVLGRDPNSGVRFDPEKDDLVGRQHARIARDPNDPHRFTVSDLNTRNGTYLNKLRVVGTMPVQPGDIIQLGAGGPELQFDIDPLPAQYVKATRMAVGSPVGGVNETRVGATAMGGGGAAATAGAGATSNAPIGGSAKGANQVGKATVERMIGQTKQEGRKHTIMVGVAALVLVAAVGAYSVKRTNDAEAAAADSLKGLAGSTARARDLGKMLTPAEVAAQFGGATVQIDMAWNLIYAPTGAQVYHETVANQYTAKNGRKTAIIPGGEARLKAYVRVDGGALEPSLTMSAGDGAERIAENGHGSGFVVTADGFILTNRHVAAGWRAPFGLGDQPGVLLQDGKIALDEQGAPIVVNPPGDYIPSETKQYGPKRETDVFKGRQEYIFVRFPKNTTPMEAQVTRVSDIHDVALIKISNPGPVPAVTLHDSYDATKVGDEVIVMGYPGLSNEVRAVFKSRDMFNRDAQSRVVPDPTLSVGNIGKIIRAADGPVDQVLQTYSPNGDTYQLTISSTGSGNSGGPMFDAYGRVIGLFFASRAGSGNQRITFAVPIRYGMQLMSVTGNVK